MIPELTGKGLDDHGTPSKPSKQDMATLNLAASDNRTADRYDDDDTTAPIIPFSRRSTRTRADQTGANATFLTECSFGVTHDKLVQLITDVQPFEPYWETLKSIDLRDRAVDNLARLKEFLPALQEVMLDGNRLSYLSGLPSSVLNLHVADNKLTSLTSVAHLKRIEILDISNNQLDSVYRKRSSPSLAKGSEADQRRIRLSDQPQRAKGGRKWHHRSVGYCLDRRSSQSERGQ